MLFIFTYLYLSSAVREYDREDTRMEIQECAAQFQAGGIDALKKEVDFEKQISRGKSIFFIRLTGPENDTLFLNVPDEWTEFDAKQLQGKHLNVTKGWLKLKVTGGVVEIASRRLPDGHLLQIGKSTEGRWNLLKRFHINFAAIVVSMISVSFTGGVFLTFRALRPIHRFIETLQSVTETGRMDIRVPTRQTGDELDELAAMFNGMLERIELLINGMKGSLDNVAHDLRTPLTRLRGRAEMALKSEPNPDALRESLIECTEESERVLTMLNTLMDISEAETGVMKLDLKEVRVLSLIGSVVELYADVAEENEVAIHLTSPEDLSLTVDSNRMQQVLANLLDNAIKYTPRGGRVGIEALRKEGEVMITVKDTGIGIPPEDLARVWDRLYRVDRSRSERGLGLGLSLVKAIVEAHKGHVGVSSEPGAGSLFSIYLPNRH
jgi:signal transduction histidine kinase